MIVFIKLSKNKTFFFLNFIVLKNNIFETLLTVNEYKSSLAPSRHTVGLIITFWSFSLPLFQLFMFLNPHCVHMLNFI